MKIEEEYLDVLQNIELSIVQEYRRDPSLLDLDARDAVEALVRHYQAEEESREPPKRRLADRAERVFRSMHAACEWRLGRESEFAAPVTTGRPVRTAEILACLRRIRKSIDFWTKEGGRQGYLGYVTQFIR